jgi:hypothetical protein
LIVLSGDQISADFCQDSNQALELYREMGNRLSQFQIPWSLVFRDTDDDSNDITCQKLLEIDQSFDYSVSEASPSSRIFGTSNYLLNIFVENTAAAQIYFMDSSGGSLPPHLDQSQVTWFSQTNQRLPAVAFQHLPTENFKFQPQKCMGYHDGEDILDTLDFDPGIVDEDLLFSRRSQSWQPLLLSVFQMVASLHGSPNWIWRLWGLGTGGASL